MCFIMMKFHENEKNTVLMKLQVMSTILANMLGSKNFRCLVGDEVANPAGQPTYDLERQPAWCDRVLHSKVSVQRKSCSAAAGATLMVLKNWAFSVGEIVLQKHFFSRGTMRYPKICKTDWGLSISLATFPQSLHDFDCLKPPSKLGRWDWDGRRRFHHKCVCPSCERWIPLDIDNG